MGTEGDKSEVNDLIAEGDADPKNEQGLIDDIHAAAALEAGVDADHAFGRVGPKFNRSSPFYAGLLGALGVAVVFVVGVIIIDAAQILLLIALAIVIAVGLDPTVTWLHRRGLPRWAAVTSVILLALALFIGFLALAIPVLVNQADGLANQLPQYLHSLNNKSTFLGKLNSRYHVIRAIQNFINKGGSSAIAGGVLGVGKVVVDLVGSVIVVVILSIYLLADLPRMKRGLYALAPRSRRPRMVLLTDEISARIGGYVLGNLLTSFIAGLGTFAWTLIFNIPYALLLGFMVALVDLVPVVGSTVGGIIVALIGLTVSLPIAIATAVFYFVYRFLEDYILTPKIMSRTVQVPGLVTVIATLIGGTLLGIIGALIAIPVAAALKLLIQETALPHLDAE